MMVKLMKVNLDWDAEALADGSQPWIDVAPIWVNPNHVTNVSSFDWGVVQSGKFTSIGIAGLSQMTVRGSVQEVLERLENARKEK